VCGQADAIAHGASGNPVRVRLDLEKEGAKGFHQEFCVSIGVYWGHGSSLSRFLIGDVAKDVRHDADNGIVVRVARLSGPSLEVFDYASLEQDPGEEADAGNDDCSVKGLGPGIGLVVMCLDA